MILNSSFEKNHFCQNFQIENHAKLQARPHIWTTAKLDDIYFFEKKLDDTEIKHCWTTATQNPVVQICGPLYRISTEFTNRIFDRNFDFRHSVTPLKERKKMKFWANLVVGLARLCLPEMSFKYILQSHLRQKIVVQLNSCPNRTTKELDLLAKVFHPQWRQTRKVLFFEIFSKKNFCDFL